MPTSIKKNSTHIIEVTELTAEARGIGSIEGIPIIVERALPGERVEIKIIKVTGNYAVGKLLDVKNPSEDRVQPFCDVFERCGGCSLQHLGYASQLTIKTAIVKEQLQNTGNLQDVIIHATMGMRNPLHYRNKAQYPVGQKKGDVVLGFYARHSHEIIGHRVCTVQHESIDRIRSLIRTFLIDNRLSVYDERLHQGLVRHIIIRVGFRTGKIMVVVVTNGKDLPHKQKLIESLVSEIPGMTSLVLNINARDTNVVLGKKNRILYGKRTITDTLGPYQFEMSPLSFYQVNPVQTEVLYGKVLEYAGLAGKETVFDLYSGIGTLSVFLASHAEKVYGVECVEDAVRDAKNNAQINNLKNIEFIQGTAAMMISELSAQGIKADVVVVDPPRKGCEKKLLEAIVKIQPDKLVYVSCSPKSLARDLQYLTEYGFKTVEIQPVDMFPHTTHIECVAKIE